MGGFPSLSCRVALGSNPFDATDVWTEIGPASGSGPGGSGWLRRVKATRGRQRLLRSQAQFQAGRLQGELDNRDRRFDPTNSAGPYWPNVAPEKKIQVGATWAGLFHPIWTGYVDDWPQVWPGMSEASVPIVATDLFKSLSVKRLATNGYPALVVADGVNAYYRLNEPSGSTQAADSSGHNHGPAVPSGNVAFGLVGALPSVGSSAVLFGSAGSGVADGQLTMPVDVLLTGTLSFAFECWVNVVPGASPFLVKMFTGGPSSIPYWMAVLVTVGGNVSVAGDLPTPASVTGTANVADGAWHHLMVAWTPSLTQVIVDGTLDVSTSVAVTGASLPSLSQIVVGGNGQLLGMEEIGFYLFAPTVATANSHFQLLAWPAEHTGERFGRVLNLLGFPAAQRRVDTGYTFCNADKQDLVSTKALQYAEKLEQSEQGQCFVGADGYAVFQDRYHRYRYPNTLPQATLGDGGLIGYPGEVPYAMGGVTLNFDRVELFNEVPATRRGGNVQVATVPASITKYGERTMPGLSDLLMGTDLDALACAQWVAADTAYPKYRPGEIILDPTCDDRLWPLVLGFDIGTVVTTVKHQIPGGGPPVTLNVAIEGIEHEIVPPRSWKTIWHTSLSGMLSWLILDDPVMDLLDGGALIGW